MCCCRWLSLFTRIGWFLFGIGIWRLECSLKHSFLLLQFPTLPLSPSSLSGAQSLCASSLFSDPLSPSWTPLRPGLLHSIGPLLTCPLVSRSPGEVQNI